MANSFFDAVYYLQENPDVFTAGYNVNTAWDHYVQYGANEANEVGGSVRAPNPWFDVKYYLSSNPDLLAGGVTPATALDHFLSDGATELRSPNANAEITEAKLSAYAAANQDLVEAFGVVDVNNLTPEEQAELINHFYAYGYKEGRPASLLDVSAGTDAGKTIYLTEGRDIENGTTGNDVFYADVVQNQFGQQVNSLGSGDVLNGGAGVDTLDATLISAYNVAGRPMDITPTTKNIENVVVNAQISDNNPEAVQAYVNAVQNLAVAEQALVDATVAGNATAIASATAARDVAQAQVDALAGAAGDLVTLNARKMEGVEKISSKYSDADLLVKNITTNGVNGGTAAMTIGMEYTGNADTNWTESNMTALFDQDYLTRTAEATNSIEIRMVDLLDNKVDGTPLTTFLTLTIRQEGKDPLVVDVTEANGLAGNAAYDKVVELLNDAFASTEGWEDVTADLLPQREASFSDDIVGSDGTNYVKGQSAGFYRPIILTSDSSAEFKRPLSTNDQEAEDFNPFFSSVEYDPEEEIVPVSINVDLEKVGLAADGGGLIIGSMNKDSQNVFGNNQGITVTDTVAGFDEFNVHVGGDKAKNSSLSYLHSTDNTLRKVTIDSKAGSDANLTIGNSNTGVLFNTSANNAQALKDVQVVDASNFNGDLVLNAGITDEIVAKYLSYDGVQPYAANNSNEVALFEYKGGNGDDFINIFIDEAALANAFVSVTNTNKNVFEMNVNGGDGDDEIIVAFDGTLLSTNGSAVTNITINGGAGNDTIYIDSANVAESTFVVEFDGNHFGHDTIIGFDAGGVVSVTDEVQTLDFDGWVAHDGETIKITVGNKSYSIVLSADQTDVQIAALVKDALDGTDVDPLNTVDLFTAGAGTTVVGTVVTATKDEENVESVKVEVLPANVHTSGSADSISPIHSEVFNTTSEGGLYSGAAGQDVLDFSAYGVDGVVIVKKDGITDLEAGTGSTNAVGDTAVYLVQSEHNDNVFNAYIAEYIVSNNVWDVGTNQDIISVIGSIDFGGDITDVAYALGGAIDASQLVF